MIEDRVMNSRKSKNIKRQRKGDETHSDQWEYQKNFVLFPGFEEMK